MSEAKVRQQYNRLANVYDQRWNYYITNTLQFLNVWVNLSPLETVLDIACGTGEFERMVLAQHPTQQMVGVDISEQMLTIAQQKLQAFPHVSFQVTNASALPFSDHSFDVVVSANAFHYFDNPVTALKEMERVLKSNGRAVILDWCRDFLLCQICDILLKLVDPGYKRCYSQDEFHQLLTSAGFKIEHARRVRFGLVWGLMVATAIPK
jgi:ubiquinone/menaquinone biosynthesis C-methylase UbiE